MIILKKFFYFLSFPVLFVLYVGIIGSAILSFLAGFLRTIGFESIKINFWYNIPVPTMLSLPFSLIVSLLLFFCSRYVKRLIKALSRFVFKMQC
ncbi:hypothetical protein BN000_05073 [Neobacillus massiliamazoniensis]|uniref:Uncharacterized protein n=1 Tax=Neobacillus massiliamazoniensis TaxID=1499688 RepID=A0A0U1P3R9_9BACI|nr:hypothetical protein BN000_05073 [Neobacillus massiliamazoniensis]